MSEEIKGRISVETENIFPIIKKWLYSERDIFIRELVSNASDAITKLKKIAFSEEFEGGTDYRIDLDFDQEKRILTIEDNGIGMSSEEVQKYINQIAFSSAEEFVKKFQGEGAKPEIIGHFGLGFYSCFMVSTKVILETKSYQKDSTGVVWESESGTEFYLRSSDKATRGTKITLHLDGDSGEYLDQWKLKELIRRYCDFLPVPIYVKNEQANKQTPLWSEAPSSVTKEKYEEFYNYLFPFSGEPLFHVHLNVDYPFRLQGILYFPKLKHELDVNQSGIKLYCNHVFV
ncbi:molecular chaperone HtpG, partial [Leptospira interrogans]